MMNRGHREVMIFSQGPELAQDSYSRLFSSHQCLHSLTIILSQWASQRAGQRQWASSWKEKILSGYIDAAVDSRFTTWWLCSGWAVSKDTVLKGQSPREETYQLLGTLLLLWYRYFWEQARVRGALPSLLLWKCALQLTLGWRSGVGKFQTKTSALHCLSDKTAHSILPLVWM